jgi:hypothetical protein
MAWPSWPAAFYRPASLWRELGAFLEFEILSDEVLRIREG